MRFTIALIASGLLALPTHAAVNGLDIPAKFGGTANALATQTDATGFGDNLSEADQLYGVSDASGIHLGVTGNIEQNGNPLILLLDTAPGGSNVLNAPAGTFKVTNANGLTFANDFTPDYAIEVDAFSGQLYGNYINLGSGANAYLGHTTIMPVAPGDYQYTPENPGFQFAYDSSNTAGVTSTDASGAATATTGLEFQLDPAALGLAPGSGFKLLAFINGAGGDYLSNQFLPGLPAGTPNLGNPKTVDLRQYGITYVNVPGSAIPEPATLTLLGIGLLPLLRRKMGVGK